MTVRAALETRLNAMTPALATSWQNNAFAPPAPSIPYQKADILFATPDNPEMGTGYRELGIFQVTLRYPLGIGSAAAELRAQALRAWFNKNLELVSGTIRVVVSRTPAIGQGVPDEDRWAVPVKIPFYANFFG